MENLITLFQDPAVWIALITLIVMEVVLGIDNLLFISILTNKLPEGQRDRARKLGIGLALILRLVLLSAVAWIVKLTTPVFELFDQGFSWKDLILIAGGLFLVWKATKEIHHTVDPEPTPDMFNSRTVSMTFTAAIGQILVLDVVFSIDSIMIGMTLIAEGFGVKVPKGYVYAAMAFSAGIEGLNMLSRRSKRRKREAGIQNP